MPPFDRPYTTSYQSAVVYVSIVFYLVPVSSYLTLKNHELEILGRGGAPIGAGGS